MNKLDRAARSQILHLLCEGSSIRAVTRLTGASKNTVIKLMIDAGKACAAYHDEHVRNLKAKRVRVDEIWSFTYAKQKDVAKAKTAPAGAGDTWTWTAIDADNKLMISWLVGGRDSDYAMAFMDDLRSRLANRVQLTSDGHRAYLEAVEGAFGGDVDYAQLVKIYGASPESAIGRYSPAECTGARKTPIEGNPDPKHISTSFAERQNLNMRVHMRRFTRLTNAFSKKVENHMWSVALFTAYYNFVRIRRTLRVTPAMAAGMTDRLWEIGDIVALVEATDKQAAKRAPYKKADAEISNCTTTRFSLSLTHTSLSSPGLTGRSSRHRLGLLDCPVKPGNDTNRVSVIGTGSGFRDQAIAPVGEVSPGAFVSPILAGR